MDEEVNYNHHMNNNNNNQKSNNKQQLAETTATFDRRIQDADACSSRN